jgi:hypothetical protein
MPEEGTQYQSPLVLQLVKNREAEQAAEAQKNPGLGDHGLQLITQALTEGYFALATEWIGVFFRVFWLSLFSGCFLFIWVFVLKLAGF